jgi:hypothetical protein
MILEICSHGECVCDIINAQDFQSPIDYLFFLFAIIQQQQKLFNRLNKGHENIGIISTNRTLSDLM